MQDKHFHSIIDMLEPGDALVMNDTRVLPARLYGQKEETGGHVELLLLKNTAGDEWEVLAKPAKRLKSVLASALEMVVSALLLRKN